MDTDPGDLPTPGGAGAGAPLHCLMDDTTGHFATVLMAFFAIMNPSLADACRCLPPEPPTIETVRAHYCEADMVFEAAVTGHATLDNGSEFQEAEQVFTLTPDTIYKGPDVATYPSRFISTASCDYRFNQDHRYLVFGHRAGESDEIRVSFCGYTDRTAQSTEKIALLDQLLADGVDPCAGLADEGAEPVSREVPANPERDTSMPEPLEEEDSLWTKVLIDFMSISVPGYLVLQIFTLMRYRERWRKLAMLPLALMVPLIAYTLFALFASSNLWPLLLLFLTPFAFVYLIALMLIRYVAERRDQA